MSITRDEMEELFVYWFCLDPFTRFVGEPPMSCCRTVDEVNKLEEEWLAQAPAEWLSIALDIIINPPDLSNWNFDSSSPSWNAEEEFLIHMEFILRHWCKHAPATWFTEMTSLLDNPVSMPPGGRYSSSREMVIAHIARVGESEFASESVVERELKWVKSRINKWPEMMEMEREAHLFNLMTGSYWFPNTKARGLLLKLGQVAGSPYSDWVDNYFKAIEEEKNDTKQ
jgi:hypothetical protein